MKKAANIAADNAVENAEKVDKGFIRLSDKIDGMFKLILRIYGDEYVNNILHEEGLMEYLKSKEIKDRIYALQRLVFSKNTLFMEPEKELERLQTELAETIARKHVEYDIQEEVEKILEERQEKLLDDLKLSILKKHKGAENSRTFKKLVELQKLDSVKLTTSVMELLRPSAAGDIVGQKRAVEALLSKVASKYPQHVILYGPPGVGKTSAARLALSIAKGLESTPFAAAAPFVEVDGTTLRWDPRDMTNPLLGTVHDPIYQGSKAELAEAGTPEPKTGLVTEAHGGILFIDEIGEIDPQLQNKLLKVLEDKKVEFSSSYYDPDDENVPMYIKKLFEEGAPADFILIGATTRQPSEINPALRSRCGEVFFEPLGKKDIMKIIKNSSQKLNITMSEDVPELISRYTIEGRKAVNILADVYGSVIYKRGLRDVFIEASDVQDAAALSRLAPENRIKAESTKLLGKVFGLGVSGFIGSILEIEAIAFKSLKETGSIRFNDTAGSMARDSVFNAASVIRSLTGKDLNCYDVHVNVIGGGNVDGPSAGAAITVAMLSAVTGRPVSQNVAITGEISLLGHIKPVGGIIEKIYGAVQAGVKKIIIPEGNRKDAPQDIEGAEIIPVSEIGQIVDIVF